MQSDVPLGAFLSGGVDSSLIVALMQKLAEQPVKTFSIGFPVKEYDETRYAHQVAEHLGTDHHEFQVTPSGWRSSPNWCGIMTNRSRTVRRFPPGTYREMTRQHVTVALTGDGGDELFVGYPRIAAVGSGHATGPTGAGYATCFGARGSGSRFRRRARQKSQVAAVQTVQRRACGCPASERYLDWICIFNTQRRAMLYTDDQFARSLPDEDPIRFLETTLWKASPIVIR